LAFESLPATFEGMSDSRKSIEVVAAVIRWEGSILCMQRGENKRSYISKKWEFPGGKVEAGETEQEALAREIKEELHLDIAVGEKIITVHHSYPDFDLVMHAFDCEAIFTLEPLIVRTEHLDHCWLSPSAREFQELDWAGADVPIVEALMVTS
jgi:8-oxo-dGTP diphosphatase